MNFENHNPLDTVLNNLFEQYRAGVPAVDKITQALLEKGIVNSQKEIVNDHIAFRTLGVPNLGIASLEKIFLHYGYRKRDYYHFKEKKLNAFWYSPPTSDYPRIFMSELIVNELSDNARTIIENYTADITSDPVDSLNLNNGEEVAAFLHTPLWRLPDLEDYKALLKESEYAAWVIYNRYYLNHYTISIHALKRGLNKLEDFNGFVESIGIKLNDAGGKIKTSADGLLSQSSTVSKLYDAVFSGGEKFEIAGSYVEFAERKVLPEFKDLPESEIKSEHRRDGFEANNADKIFESTYTGQITGGKK